MACQSPMGHHREVCSHLTILMDFLTNHIYIGLENMTFTGGIILTIEMIMMSQNNDDNNVAT